MKILGYFITFQLYYLSIYSVFFKNSTQMFLHHTEFFTHTYASLERRLTGCCSDVPPRDNSFLQRLPVHEEKPKKRA